MSLRRDHDVLLPAGLLEKQTDYEAKIWDNEGKNRAELKADQDSGTENTWF